MHATKTQRGASIVLLLTAALGFASFLAMNSFSLWGLPTLSNEAFGDQVSLWWIQPLSLSNIMAFFAFFGAAQCWGDHLPRIPFPAAVILLASGIVLLLGFFLSGSIGALAAAGLLVGAGTTCCFFCWEHLFCKSGALLGKAQLVGGSLLSIPAFGLLFLFGGQNILFSVSLLALGNLVLLWVSRILLCRMESAHENPTDRSSEDPGRAGGTSGLPRARSFFSSPAGTVLPPSSADPSQSPLPPLEARNVRRALVRAACCIVMVGTISPILDVIGAQSPVNPEEDCFLLLGANAISALIMALVWFALRRKTSITGVYAVLFPVLITGFFVLPFLQPDYYWLIFFLGKFSFTLFSIVTMDWCATVAREARLNLFAIYGLLGGLLYTSRFVGTFVASLVGGSSLSHETQLFACVAILLYGCAVVMFVVTRKEGEVSPSSELAPSKVSTDGTDLLHWACLEIAEERGLSLRQTEVLDLLAHGYDVPSAAKKLFISENTVRTHLKKIYSSLEVHSRQEVIDLVNSRFSDASEER